LKQTLAIVKADASNCPSKSGALSVPHPNLWSPDDPFLYNLEVEVLEVASEIEIRKGSSRYS
jgi:beta-galactosidase/beta-glucuronidase